MKKWSFFLMILITISITGQVGINTVKPQTTLEVVGKPTDVNHFDGIIPPRISGDQLAAKLYHPQTKGAIVYVNSIPQNPSGQVIKVSTAGLYYFDGTLWQSISVQKDPIEYQIVLSFDSNSTADLTATSGWSPPINYFANTNVYLTSAKTYTIGTKNFGGLKGSILFRKLLGSVNVRFQIYRSHDSAPISGNAFMNISDINNDIGYFPNQIALLHTENLTHHFPLLLENNAIQIPHTSLTAMSTMYYTYGEVQGYSNRISTMP